MSERIVNVGGLEAAVSRAHDSAGRPWEHMSVAPEHVAALCAALRMLANEIDAANAIAARNSPGDIGPSSDEILARHGVEL